MLSGDSWSSTYFFNRHRNQQKKKSNGSREISYRNNPFSVLHALRNREIEPYWFETGTPTFLARKIKERGVAMPALNGITRQRESLITVGINSSDAVPLMFQTGYLTIDSYDSRLRRMKLRFPNKEVEIGFAMNLLPLYAPPMENMNCASGRLLLI